MNTPESNADPPPMTPFVCPHCGLSGVTNKYRFCPNCSVLLRHSPPEAEEAKLHVVFVAQKMRPLPMKVALSPGPLLTGNVTLDLCLGFMGETIALIQIFYGLFSVMQALSRFDPVLSPRTILWGTGAMITGILLFWYMEQMCPRYPTLIRGQEESRRVRGMGLEVILNVATGAAVLTVLFPLGALLLCGIQALGTIGWIVAISIAYGIGALARVMNNATKRGPIS